jgi:hypothetical protein
VLAGVPFGQPALSLAAQLQRRAERAGLSVSLNGAGSADSDGDAGLTGERLGAELMASVARAQAVGLDPELELRAAAWRFADYVHAQERLAGSTGKVLAKRRLPEGAAGVARLHGLVGGGRVPGPARRVRGQRATPTCWPT